MTLSIEPADFEDPSLGAFLEAHLADMAPQSPLESQHALDLAALRQPTVRLWAAQKDHRIVGTCTLAVLEPGHEELKSMRTDPDFRGQGVASRLLLHALEDAAQRKLSRISLETGAMEFFAPARSLYRKHGFKQCQPFGSYQEDPNSIYMTRIFELNLLWGRALQGLLVPVGAKAMKDTKFGRFRARLERRQGLAAASLLADPPRARHWQIALGHGGLSGCLSRPHWSRVVSA